MDNATDADPSNNFDADPDGDGLKNYEEADHGTRASSSDSDGDGIGDNGEVQQGSDPANANSTQEPAGGVVPVMVTWGDPSGSHSEKYQIRLIAVEGSSKSWPRTNRRYGQTQTEIFRLPRGSKFRVELHHAGTDPRLNLQRPDYDYQLDIVGAEIDPTVEVITNDQSGILGEHNESDEFFAKSKSADLYVAWLTSNTTATIPTNTDRKKLGVGEFVNMKLRPAGMPSPAWAITGAADNSRFIQPAGDITQFQAGKRACNPTIEATILGKKLSIGFNVIEPIGESAEKIRDLTTADRRWTTDQKLGVGMQLRITTLPTDVSFINVEVIEKDKGTFSKQGYFMPYNPIHRPDPDWIELSDGNTWLDTAGFGDLTGQIFPQPWSYGYYEFKIEVRWRVIKQEEGSDGVFLANRLQKHTLVNSTGKSTVEKLTNSATRTPLQ